MKKVNFYRLLVNLKGESVKDQETGEPLLISKMVGNLLVGSKAQKDAIRQMDVARKIYNSDGEIELEDADLETVKKVVGEANMSCLARSVFDECIKVAEGK